MHISLCSFLCSCNFSHLLYFFYSSPTFCAIPTFLTLSHFSCISDIFQESVRKLFCGDPGTPGNVKEIAGDCQRLLEIVDNSSFKHVTILTKSYKKLILFGGFETSAFFNDQGNFLGRRKHY